MEQGHSVRLTRERRTLMESAVRRAWIETIGQKGVEEMAKIATAEHLAFLDNLRDSGVTNMFGATPYLLRKFPDMDRHAATEVLSEWMRTYEQRHPNG